METLIKQEDVIRLFDKRIREFKNMDYERGIVVSLFDEFLSIPHFESNLLIAPETIERDDVVDIGSDITVIHHENYMDMYCKSILFDEYCKDAKFMEET